MKVAFLTQRLPYAPNRGDRVRAYHELQQMAAAGHEVHLVSLVHDSEEASQTSRLSAVAASVRVARVPRKRNMLLAVPHLLGRRPLTHLLLDSPEIRPTLRTLLSEVEPDVVLAYCSSMARFAIEPPLSGMPFLLDMVDVDSAKWAALAETSRFPLRLVYAREARVLARFEAQAMRLARRVFVVNDREASLLTERGDDGAKVQVLPNGIDVAYWVPPGPRDNGQDVVFCGVMDYTPNEEGALWLGLQVWPKVLARCPSARLWIVGSNPTRRLLDLSREASSIRVTGTVPDVRPYLWKAAVAAAPLLIARGVQNKVLEAVAAGLPTVVTPAVAAGLPPEVMTACVSAESPDLFASALVGLLARPADERRRMAASARLRELTWDSRLSPLLRALSPPIVRRSIEDAC
jgi:polysaccharide biosynthesis protein PslH